GACVDKVVFVTSTSYDGNLGGLTGGDAKCQARAVAAGLAGTYKAWLCSGSTSAASRLSHLSTGDYVRLDGAVLANGWAGLTDDLGADWTNSCAQYGNCQYKAPLFCIQQ